MIPAETISKNGHKDELGPHQNQVLGLAQQFVLTAVRRTNVDASWEMVCPEMRQGYSRQSWSKGEIPVVPFPAQFAKWHLAYSYRREIDLQVALYAKPETKRKPSGFDLTLHPCGGHASKRWLVSSFIPTPSASGDFGTTDDKSDIEPDCDRHPRSGALPADARERSVARDSARDHGRHVAHRSRDRRLPQLYGQARL